MNHSKFKQYHTEHQLLLTMNNGVLLMECRKFNVLQRLFAFEDFYVEVTSNDDTDEVVDITAHENLNSLDEFVADIDISGLFK